MYSKGDILEGLDFFFPPPPLGFYKAIACKAATSGFSGGFGASFSAEKDIHSCSKSIPWFLKIVMQKQACCFPVSAGIVNFLPSSRHSDVVLDLV